MGFAMCDEAAQSRAFRQCGKFKRLHYPGRGTHVWSQVLDVVAGEFAGDCQILDKLIKGLLDDGFAVKRSSGWHSLAELYNYTHTARGFLY